ncbi:MAG TPA: IclR family transcriptional regulator [bacterium]|nr:IclR family transcriptional regulator [bacterium]
MVKTVRRAVEILGCFSRARPVLGVSEISRDLRLPKSAVSRVLQTLEQAHFLERDASSRKYRPGVRAFEFGSLYRHDDPLLQRAWNAVRELVRLTGHNGYLLVLLGREALVLAREDGTYPVRLIVPPGEHLLAYTTAAGKALLAALDERQVRRLYPEARLKAMTTHTIATRAALLTELTEIRRRGYAVADQETYYGTRAVGVAAADPGREQSVGVSLSFPIGSVSPAEERRIVGAMLEARARLAVHGPDATATGRTGTNTTRKVVPA